MPQERYWSGRKDRIREVPYHEVLTLKRPSKLDIQAALAPLIIWRRHWPISAGIHDALDEDLSSMCCYLVKTDFVNGSTMSREDERCGSVSKPELSGIWG